MTGLADLFNMMRLMSAQQKTTVSLDGYVYPDSYDPSDGTVTVTIADTAALSPNVAPDDPNPIVLQKVALSVPAYGFQHGPVGGERVTVIAAQGGTYRAVLDYDEDDSPGAPAGETWMVHRTGGLTNLTPNAFSKLTNDGKTPGDGQGGFRAGGTAYSSLVGALVELGSEGLEPIHDAVVIQQNAQALADALIAVVQAAFNQLCLTLQAGPGVPPPQVGSVTAQGSSVVKAAP